MPRVAKANSDLMRSYAFDLPQQLRRGFALGRDLSETPSEGTRTVFAVGVGGSAIASDLLANLTDPETDLALCPVRGPRLPRALGRRSLVIAVSYSGDTRETLAAYDEAGRRGARRVALSSGGELARRAEKDRVPHLLIPPGIPPRAAVGYLVGGLLGIFDGFFPESNEARLHRAADHLDVLQPAYASAHGGPAQLARRVGHRTPYIYANSDLVAVARRWTTQVEENAKRLAHFDSFPELMHNALVAWDAIPRLEAGRKAVLVLDPLSGLKSPGTSTEYLLSLLKRRGVLAEKIALNLDDRLEAIVTGVSYGDHFSLALSDILGEDPFEIRAIVRLKRSVRAR